MKIRKLKHHIIWENAWKEMRKEKMRKLKVSYDDEFFKKSANDFSERIKLNDYEFGRKKTEILAEVIDDNFEVLEIGTGPGTLTVPLAKKVKKITGIEFAERNIKNLKLNLKENNLSNVEIINKRWEEIENAKIKGKFDLVVCSHFLWQIKNIDDLLRRMENASRRYYSIIQPCGRDELIKEIFEKISNQKYTGQFEPDADYFAYVILREWGRLVSVKYFDYTFERDMEEQIRNVASFIGRFYEVDTVLEKRIKDYLLEISEDGIYREENKAAVMWWQPGK
jgi:ubiquinone/menaquinone biosynthesis C-methylase UbiE